MSPDSLAERLAARTHDGEPLPGALEVPDEAADPYRGTWLERYRDRRRAAAGAPGSRAHAFRHHQPRTIAAQAARVEQALEGSYDAWHQRWIARPGTWVSAAIDWVTQDGRHFWGAAALLLAVLAVLTAAIHAVP